MFSVAFIEQKNDGSQKISGQKLKDLYKSFVTEYPIVSIEDPFDQDDWEHYALMTGEIGEKVQIVGDDLLVTNPKVRFPILLSQSPPKRRRELTVPFRCVPLFSFTSFHFNKGVVHRIGYKFVG